MRLYPRMLIFRFFYEMVRQESKSASVVRKETQPTGCAYSFEIPTAKFAHSETFFLPPKLLFKDDSKDGVVHHSSTKREAAAAAVLTSLGEMMASVISLHTEFEKTPTRWTKVYWTMGIIWTANGVPSSRSLKRGRLTSLCGPISKRIFTWFQRQLFRLRLRCCKK